ncbi:MAG: S8 family serine peptidase [Bacteroidota bacterium]
MGSKTYRLFIVFNLLGAMIQAQVSTKLDLRLWERLHDGNISEQNMPLLVKGDLNEVQALTERLGGTYKYGHNNISSVEIPERNLLAFSDDKAIEKIENTGAKGVFLMDTARIRNNIDSVHSGFAPLPNNLKGRNVVIGIIDGGIYFQHYDFRNPADSTTRIRYIWDQVATGGVVPAPYNYGRQWTSTNINNGTCTHVPPANDFGHGTSVAGIAAGNSLSTKGTAYENQFTGVAPESQIIAVRVKNDNNFLTNVSDAVDYIFKKADSLGLPCVINTSVGTYYGSHDGLDLTSQLIDAMLDEKNGRALVASAGNAGNIRHHLGYNVPTDSAYTYFTYTANPSVSIYFDLWADTADFNNTMFKVGASVNNGTIINGTEYFNVPLDFNPPQGNYVIVNRSLTNGSLTDQVSIAATLDGERYHVEFLIYPSKTANYWRLQTSGSGKFDAWSNVNLTGTANMTRVLTGNVFITDPHYRHPDTLKTMVSSWQNSDKVITVGNYSNRAGYTGYTSTYVNLTIAPDNEVVGRRAAESSLGPTRDNRMKPDLMATGNTTLCTGDANNIASLLSTSQGYKVARSGKHSRNGGTSMASPIVAGIAALYLEKRSNASYAEIKQALICTATEDNFTGSTPNHQYGNGKVNAFAALTSVNCVSFGSNDTSCLNYNPVADFDSGCVAKVYGCMDTASINYDSLVNVDNGSCIPKVYGCTDTGSINYNALANVNDGTCILKVYGSLDTACINYNPASNVIVTCIAKVYGCIDTASINYDALANVNDGSCVAKMYGCTDTASINYNALANVNDGSCIAKVYGCTDTASINYDALANVNDGSCIAKVYGCTDTAAINYNALANVSDGTCIAKLYGCTDTASINYDALANVNDGSCIAKVYGCTDTASINYNVLANVNDGSCIAKVYGCTDTASINYDALANVSNGSCVAKVYGCTDTASINYNALANVNDGSCIAKVYGCTDTAAINYDALANVNDGSCVAKVYGCTDTAAINYNALANVNDGSCIAKVYGCNDTASINYNVLANVTDGSCIAKVYGCTDTAAINYDALANVNDGSCIAKVYGCSDTASINYDALANVNDGSCIAKVYGCTDTAAINYNALANVDDGSCLPSSIMDMNADTISVQVMPNPFAGETTFKLTGAGWHKGSIRIYNVLGETVGEIVLSHNRTEYIYTSDAISKGVYFYLLTVEGRNIKAGKLVAE